MRSVLIYCLVAGIILCMLTSCGNTRHLTYMQGKFDTASLSQINLPEPTIQKGDLVSIIVYSDNPSATALFNQSVTSSGAASSANSNPGGGTGSMTGATSTIAASSPGYLVD